MRFCRFDAQDGARYGLIETTAGQDIIRRILTDLPTGASDFDRGQSVEIPLASVRLLAPVSPSKIVCIGRNYREHAKELNHPIPTEPLIFLKPPSAVLAPGGTVLRPDCTFAARRSRGRARSRHRQALPWPARRRRRARLHSRLHLRQRRHCPRLAEQRRPVVARQGVRHLLPHRSGRSFGLDPWKGVRVQTRVNGQLARTAPPRTSFSRSM